MSAKFHDAVRAFVAAVTSPTVVKAEKNVLVLVVTRVLIAVGAGDGLVKLIQSLAS